jgi:hypothetical protein
VSVFERKMGRVVVLLAGVALFACPSCHRGGPDPASRNLALADDKTPFTLEKATFENEATRQRQAGPERVDVSPHAHAIDGL